MTVALKKGLVRGCLIAAIEAGRDVVTHKPQPSGNVKQNPPARWLSLTILKRRVDSDR